MRALKLVVIWLGIVVSTAAYAATNDSSSGELNQIFQELVSLTSRGISGAADTPDDRKFKFLMKRASELSASRSGKKQKSAGTSAQGGAANPPPDDIHRGQQDWRRSQGLPPIVKTMPAKKADDFCDPSTNIYVRADRLDTYLYGVQSLDAAKGASVSFTDDQLTKHQTTNISGFASYVMYRDVCIDPPKNQAGGGYLSGAAFAPWVYGNEPPRVFRRPFRLSHAAMAACCSMA